MRGHWIGIGIVGLGLATVAPARAQDGPFDGTTIEVAAQGGALFFDVGGMEPAYGGRAMLRFPNGIGVGVAADFASRGETEIETTHEVYPEADVQLFAGEVSYTLPSATRANFFGFIGGGVARFDTPDGGTESEVLIPLGLGMLWYNHPGSPWWALRAEFRDNIVWVDDDPDIDRDASVQNNYGLAFGLSILLGS